MNFELIPNRVKEGFKILMQPLVAFLARHHMNPNFFTTLSLVICAVSGITFANGHYRAAGLILLIGSFFDMIDGAVARTSNRVTRFGALYDSTLDRYAELIVFFGIGYHFIVRHAQGFEYGLLVSMAVFFAVAGSVMVSYVRARAEGLGFECKVGLMQRPERIVLISLAALISEMFLIIAVLIVAVLANFTAFQRIYHIYVTENAGKWKKLPSDVDHE